MMSTILIIILGIGFVISSEHSQSTNELKYECERNGTPDTYKKFIDLLKIFIERVHAIKNRVLHLKGTELYSEKLLRTLVFKKLCLPLQEDIEPILDLLKACFDPEEYTDDELAESKKLMHLYICDFLLSAVKETSEGCEQEKNAALQHCFNANPSIKSLPTLSEKMSEAQCKDMNILLNCFGDLTRDMKCGRRIEMKLINFQLARYLISACDSWVF